jgi:hypothetical protein
MPTEISELPQFLRDMIASPPKGGGGVHQWIWRVCRQLHAHRSEQEMYDLLKATLEGCGRAVDDTHDLWDAIRRSKDTAWRPNKDGGPIITAQPSWPAPDKQKIDDVVRHGMSKGLQGLWNRSPVKLDPEKVHAEEYVDALFPHNPLLCVGKNSREFETSRLSNWRHKLANHSLIVPSPMTRVWGKTKDGKPSQHTLDAVGPRRFLVVEFDFSVKARDGVTDTEWAPIVQAWYDDGYIAVDACAVLLAHLAARAPLTVAVHSGGKSLHGWFYCGGREDDKLRPFMEYAVTLGADPITWTKSQFVRMPDGTRENGKRQRVYFFDPEAIS